MKHKLMQLIAVMVIAIFEVQPFDTSTLLSVVRSVVSLSNYCAQGGSKSGELVEPSLAWEQARLFSRQSRQTVGQANGEAVLTGVRTSFCPLSPGLCLRHITIHSWRIRLRRKKWQLATGNYEVKAALRPRAADESGRIPSASDEDIIKGIASSNARAKLHIIAKDPNLTTVYQAAMHFLRRGTKGTERLIRESVILEDFRGRPLYRYGFMGELVVAKAMEDNIRGSRVIEFPREIQLEGGGQLPEMDFILEVDTEKYYPPGPSNTKILEGGLYLVEVKCPRVGDFAVIVKDTIEDKWPKYKENAQEMIRQGAERNENIIIRGVVFAIGGKVARSVVEGFELWGPKQERPGLSMVLAAVPETISAAMPQTTRRYTPRKPTKASLERRKKRIKMTPAERFVEDLSLQLEKDGMINASDMATVKQILEKAVAERGVHGVRQFIQEILTEGGKRLYSKATRTPEGWKRVFDGLNLIVEGARLQTQPVAEPLTQETLSVSEVTEAAETCLLRPKAAADRRFNITAKGPELIARWVMTVQGTKPGLPENKRALRSLTAVVDQNIMRDELTGTDRAKFLIKMLALAQYDSQLYRAALRRLTSTVPRETIMYNDLEILLWIHEAYQSTWSQEKKNDFSLIFATFRKRGFEISKSYTYPGRLSEENTFLKQWLSVMRIIFGQREKLIVEDMAASTAITSKELAEMLEGENARVVASDRYSQLRCSRIGKDIAFFRETGEAVQVKIADRVYTDAPEDSLEMEEGEHPYIDAEAVYMRLKAQLEKSILSLIDPQSREYMEKRPDMLTFVTRDIVWDMPPDVTENKPHLVRVMNVIQHVPEDEKADFINKAARWVRPGGCLIIGETPVDSREETNFWIFRVDIGQHPHEISKIEAGRMIHERIMEALPGETPHRNIEVYI